MREEAEWIERQALLDLGRTIPTGTNAGLVTAEVGVALAVSALEPSPEAR